MTGKEAKKIIFNQWQSFLEHNIDYGGISEAYKMAMKALEQQPSEDYISRQEALKVMCDNCPMHNCVCGCSSYRHIERMASVTPKTDVLDKIEAEIDQKQYDFMDDKDYDEGIRFGLMLAYQIINKYKEESEEV